MRYGMLVAMVLACFLVGGTCFPLLRLDDSGIHLGPDDESTTSGSTLSVSVITPAVSREVWMGTPVEIEWTASNRTDSPGVATILVRAREDFAETILAGGLRIPEAGGTRLTEWDTSDFLVGEYEVIARIEAGDETGQDVAPGRITINIPPEFEFTEPAEDTELIKKPDPNDPDGPLLSARVTIGWTGFDPDGDATAEIRIDPIDPNDPNDPFDGSTPFDPNEPFDPDLANRPDYESGDEITIATLELPTTEDPNSLEWDGTDSNGNPVDTGKYLLFAVVSDRAGERSRFLCKGTKLDDEGKCTPVQLSVPEPIELKLIVRRIKEKWGQQPQTNPASAEPSCFWGWDERSAYDDSDNPIVADDWVGLDDEPISEIRWWGSYQGWDSTEPPAERPERFHLAIWEKPAEEGESSFGHPGRMVWESWVDLSEADPNEFTETREGCDYHPDLTESRETCFRYSYSVPESDWFHQDPNEGVYWISVSADYGGVQPDYPWGWQTRERDPESSAVNDAVRISETAPNGAPTVGARYAEGEPIRTTAPTVHWDMAFELQITEMQTIEFLRTDDPLPIEFTLDEEDAVRVDIRADVDDDHGNANEVVIVRRRLVEKGTKEDSLDWDGADADDQDVSDGIYKLFMVVDRGTANRSQVEAEGLVYRRSEEEQPLIALLKPDADQTVDPGDIVSISWRDDDPSGAATIRLTLDDDPVPNQKPEDEEGEPEHEILPFGDQEAKPDGGVHDAFSYDVPATSDLPFGFGRYYVFAYVDRDGVADVDADGVAHWDNISVAAGQIVIEEPDE